MGGALGLGDISYYHRSGISIPYFLSLGLTRRENQTQAYQQRGGRNSELGSCFRSHALWGSVPWSGDFF